MWSNATADQWHTGWCPLWNVLLHKHVLLARDVRDTVYRSGDLTFTHMRILSARDWVESSTATVFDPHLALLCQARMRPVVEELFADTDPTREARTGVRPWSSVKRLR